LTPDSAVNVANNFLGVTGEDLGEQQQDQVLRELANMICGRFLSNFEPGGRFELGSPVSMPGAGFAAFAAQLNDQVPVAQAAMRLDEGALSMILSLEGTVVCPLAA
jgi:CheY-specific phosphatase CheX